LVPAALRDGGGVGAGGGCGERRGVSLTDRDQASRTGAGAVDW
jgi:hypothetical protein